MQLSKRAIANVFYTTVLGLCSMNLDAASITGTVNFGAQVGVSATTVDFFSNTATGCGTAGVGTPGCFSISGKDLSFAPFSFGSSANYSIKDLTGGPVTGTLAIPLAAFIQFTDTVNSANTITFDLTKILPGGGAVCNPALLSTANYSCTPAGSPFLLQNSSDGLNAAIFFNVEVLAYQGSSASGTSSYSGGFSTQTVQKNIAQIFTTLGTPGGTVNASYSATFVGTPNTGVPEPGTLGTLGLGIAALAFGAFRRKSGSEI